MKLQAEVNGKNRNVELTECDGKVLATLDGEPYDIEVSSPEPNVLLIKHEGNVYESLIQPDPERSSAKVVSVNGVKVTVSLTDPKKLSRGNAQDFTAGGAAEIKTAMHGKVVKILLEAGASVEKGDGVIVVEAMKMQNELKAPRQGVVSTIKVNEGDAVAAGDVLATIE